MTSVLLLSVVITTLLWLGRLTIRATGHAQAERTRMDPGDIERKLTARLLSGEISRDGYHKAMAALATDTDA